ncbi:hypothetical protein FOZ62_032001 [Perkinsus olseni]|uniref:Uncharacterized protein n=1 Tax=Perkinsus olseni TaxID=32597 RepID=A0A7J6RWE1_PEROL|nr:hypothetical protein FOZ62_032001 [Perkinsus olseni]
MGVQHKLGDLWEPGWVIVRGPTSRHPVTAVIMRDRQSKIVNLCYIKLDDREEVMTQYDKKLQAPVPLAKRRPNVEIEIVELDDVEEKKGRDEGDGLESDRVLHSPTFLPAKGLRSRRPVTVYY